MDLPDEAVRLLNDRSAVKTLATTALDGTVSLVNIRGVNAPERNIIVLAQPGGVQIDRSLCAIWKPAAWCQSCAFL